MERLIPTECGTLSKGAFPCWKKTHWRKSNSRLAWKSLAVCPTDLHQQQGGETVWVPEINYLKGFSMYPTVIRVRFGVGVKAWVRAWVEVRIRAWVRIRVRVEVRITVWVTVRARV